MTKIFLLIFIFSLFSCDRSSLIKYEPKSAKDVLQAKCVSCHSYLAKDDQFLTQMEYVIPGSPETSILYRFLKNAHVNGPENMPPKETLSQLEIKLIRDWIKNIKVQTISLTQSISKSVNPLSDAKLFARCSLQLTNDKNSKYIKSIYTSIQNKNITAVQGCLQLIENSKLNKSGQLKNINPSSMETLLTFQKVHNNWFNEWNFFVAMSTWGTFEILDPGSMGYFFTKSLFDKKYTFKDIFKGHVSFEGIRRSDVNQEFLLYKFKNEPRYKLKDYRFVYGLSEESPYKVWNPNRVPTGELIGVREIPLNRDILKSLVNSKDNQKEIRPAKEIEVNKDIHAGLGGGLLGSEAYLSLNLGQDLGRSMDGGRIVPRRWAKAIVNELLCRELPVIPILKAQQFVLKDSSLPFRKKDGCMSCHATMDGMSYLARNIEQSLSADAGGDGMIHSTHLRFHKPIKFLPQELIAPDNDKSFHLRPPKGNFIYQDVRGNFINKSINSMDELGSALLETDDLYLCTVKKYLHFLTGIKVDMNIFMNNKLSKKEVYIKNLLENAGMTLKRNGDLSEAVGIILNSKIYRSKNFSVKFHKKDE